MSVSIPRKAHLGDEDPGPCWYSVRNRDGSYAPPIIRCNCGKLTGIASHAIRSDGVVTPSFYHKQGTVYPEDPEGCGWYEHIHLMNYDCGEFPPTRTS